MPEKVVQHKLDKIKSKKERWIKNTLILSCGLYLTITFIVQPPNTFLMILLILSGLAAIAVTQFFLVKLNKEFQYEVGNGHFTIDIITNKKKTQRMVDLSASEIQTIGKYYDSDFVDAPQQRKIELCADLTDKKRVWYCLNKNGQIVLFTPNQALVDALRDMLGIEKPKKNTSPQPEHIEENQFEDENEFDDKPIEE